MVEPVRDRRATLWAVGDAAGAGGAGDRVAALVSGADPDRFLYVGDVYESGSAQDYAEYYAPRFGRLDAIATPTPGNHEWRNRATGYYPYWAQAKGRPIPDYYAYRVGDWQLLSLNSEQAHDPDSPQVAWLERRLRRSREFGNCRIAFWHRPLESAGLAHGDQEDVEPFWDQLAGRARLVINGHEHTMQRMRRRDGIVELITGAGGRMLQPIDDRDTRLRYASDADYGALRVRLRGTRAGTAFVDPAGTVLDSNAVRCRRD